MRARGIHAWTILEEQEAEHKRPADLPGHLECVPEPLADLLDTTTTFSGRSQCLGRIRLHEAGDRPSQVAVGSDEGVGL